MKRPMPQLIPCGCAPVHRDKECDYYFRALRRHPWTEHDIIMARWQFKLMLEAIDERKIYPMAH